MLRAQVTMSIGGYRLGAMRLSDATRMRSAGGLKPISCGSGRWGFALWPIAG